MKSIILASSSPRRKELLEKLKIPFTIKTFPVDEKIEEEIPIEKAVEKLAGKKAMAVANEISGGIVLGADTVVSKDKKVLGKPDSAGEALEMLRHLQGSYHEVYTGLALVDAAGGRNLFSHQETRVYFRRASTEELKAYIDTGEPMDKAGAYGIQGLGSVFVSEIHGCYFNVVGLPVSRLVEMLAEFDINTAEFWKNSRR